MQTISLRAARRIALGAQGFGAARPTGRVDRRHVRRLFATVGVVQVDSVNVIVRSQELPLWARLGAHRRDLYEMVGERGPVSAGELTTGGGRSEPWWGWSNTKLALEYLFWCGRISARRRATFERVYDLTERMIPAAVLARPAPSEDDAKRALLERAGRHIGIGTTRDLADYYRLNIPQSRPLVSDLVEEGALVEVAVEGWREPAFMHRDARIPRRIDAATLLSPFDSVVWERSRNERLFDFHYRIEIYTPAPKRIYGYYVLPFLLGDRLVARVDLKADRQASTLLAHGAFTEAGVDPETVAGPLARELTAVAEWLGLERVAPGRKGDVVRPLARALASKTGA